MSPIKGFFDLNIGLQRKGDIDSFIEMARQLGFHGFAVQGQIGGPFEKRDDGFILLNRYNLPQNSKKGMKNKVKQYRNNVIIITAPLTNVNLANWAAEETMIDMLTLVPPYHEHRLRKTTAKLAASNGTMLEVPIAPLLTTDGMMRARILKAFRESVATAIGSGMTIILSSGATKPLGMRSPRAMQYIGQILGMEAAITKKCVCENTAQIIDRNKQKIAEGYIQEGIEIVKEADDK